MPAIPALIMAGGSIAGSVIGGKVANSAAKKAAQRSPEEQALMDQQGQRAEQLGQQGNQLFKTGMPQIRSTIDYYRTLLDGSRSARMNAVSGEAQDTAEAYQGADAAANKNLRGGEREQAISENSRAKAGNISRLVTGVRPGAAAALGNVGTNLVGASEGFEGAAADIGGGLLSNSTNNRQEANKIGEAAGARTSAAIGNLTGAIAGAFKPSAAKVPRLEGGATIGRNLPVSTQLPPPSLPY